MEKYITEIERKIKKKINIEYYEKWNDALIFINNIDDYKKYLCIRFKKSYGRVYRLMIRRMMRKEFNDKLYKKSICIYAYNAEQFYTCMKNIMKHYYKLLANKDSPDAIDNNFKRVLAQKIFRAKQIKRCKELSKKSSYYRIVYNYRSSINNDRLLCSDKLLDYFEKKFANLNVLSKEDIESELNKFNLIIKI